MNDNDGQIAKRLYLRNMSGMKQILNMGEGKFGSRDSGSFKFFKKVVMDEIYNSLVDTFEAMARKGMLVKCSCGTTIRQGYKPCEKCNGAGFCNTQEFDEWINFDPNAEDTELELPI